MGNPIAWFEILGPEPEKAASFYSDLLGWHTTTAEGGYILVDTHAGGGTNGGISRPPSGWEQGTVFYVADPDIQALLDAAVSKGATMLAPVTEIPDMVTFAAFTDPWGNRVGLIKGDVTGAEVSAGSGAPVDWVEIGCAEPEKAAAFYAELFGWTFATDMKGEGGGPVHAGFEAGAGGVNGGVGSSPDGKPRVDVYARVDDVGKFLTRAEELGGTTIMPAMQVDEHTVIAMFADPQGTTFGLYSGMS
jgi:predicted enzyme related to lactoylglutathione lyase